MGRFLKHGEGYPDWSLRLFDRRQARWSDDVVHEYVQCDGAVEKLAGDLMHESGEDIALYLNKQNRYTSLQAEMLYKRGKKAGWASWCSARCCALPSFTWYAVVFWMVCPDLSTSALVASTAISNTPSSTSCTGWKKIMKILVTGAAGFIGRAVCERLLQAGDCTVVGVDNLNSYYPVSLKQARLATLEGRDGFRFVQLDLADWAALNALCGAESFDYVIHLAAQAGVRYSIDNPHVYAQSNLLGMTNVLEACRRHQVKHWCTPVPAACTARMPKCHLQKTTGWMRRSASMPPPRRPMKSWPTAMPTCMPCRTGLRFFTVYGPWGSQTWPLAVYRGNITRQANQGIQPRSDAARFHLHRRYRGRRAAGDAACTGKPQR
jgi:hypothetical protein